ncbi:uncharacterized protein [Epargyreus clarus]|uniref:uncharacterized protein isoform X2 n=1 Tax=Epargyreus clarus TaxID=520877 RepID=UPI003C2FDA83
MTVTLQYDTKSATSSPEPLFTRCCCCIPLRVGCFILGYLNLNRPGPIRVYVGVATARLIIFLAILIYLTVIGMGINNIVTYSVDIGSAAYFILVYYIYAGQLERKKVPEPEISNIKVSDIAFVYPTKIDKQTLVA